MNVFKYLMIYQFSLVFSFLHCLGYLKAQSAKFSKKRERKHDANNIKVNLCEPQIHPPGYCRYTVVQYRRLLAGESATNANIYYHY